MTKPFREVLGQLRVLAMGCASLRSDTEALQKRDLEARLAESDLVEVARLTAAALEATRTLESLVELLNGALPEKERDLEGHSDLCVCPECVRCVHHPGLECGCYCRFMGCSPVNCPREEATG